MRWVEQVEVLEARSRTQRRSRAFSMAELVISLAVVSVIMFGVTGAILVAGRSVTTAGAGHADPAQDVSQVAARIARDLHFAIVFEQRSNQRVTFTVPDRNGDGGPEKIRYRWSGTPGDPLRYWINGSDPIVLLEHVDHFSFDFITRDVTGIPMEDPGVDGSSGNVLVVVPDELSLSPSDLAHETLVESWGWKVRWISATALQSEFDDEVNTKCDVVLVTPDVSDAALGTKITPALIGIVNSSADMLDEFGFSRTVDMVPGVAAVDLIDATHYVSASFTPGPVTFLSTGQVCPRAVSKKAPELVVFGETERNPSDRAPSFGALHSGAVTDTDDSGDPIAWAADRRVLLPWGSSGFDPGTLNANGQTMLRRALEWAAHEESVGTFGHDVVFTTPVTSVQDIQIATRVTLTEFASVTSLTAYTRPDKKKVRFAIYDDASGEPGTLIVESEAFKTPTSNPTWITGAIPITPLAPGDYWLALAFERNNQDFYQESGGETRYLVHDAVSDGFLPTWGVSDNTYSISVSMYGTYYGN